MRVVRFSASPPGRLFMASSHAGLQFPIRRQFLVRLFVGENRQIPGAFFLGRNVHFFCVFPPAGGPGRMRDEDFMRYEKRTNKWSDILSI